MSKKSAEDCLIVRNKKTIEFYKQHEYLDFEQVNTQVVELLNSLFQNANNTITQSNATQILQQCMETNIQLSLQRKDLETMKANIEKLNSDITIRAIDIKKEYIEEVKNIIAEHDTDSVDKMMENMDKTTQSWMDKTKMVLLETIPSINDATHKQLSLDIQNLYTNINAELHKLKSTDVANDQIIHQIGSKFSEMFQTIQQPLLTIIGTQDRNSQILGNVEEHFNKYKNSSSKGSLSEFRLQGILNRMYPTAEIRDTRKIPESGDYQLKRENCDLILIETKDHSENVNPIEVDKFIRDCSIQNSHGIFLSQNTGITSKYNYQIEVHNGKFLIYIHNADYQSDKIKIAVEIIDSLVIRFKDFMTDKETDTIAKELLDEINDEYQKFITQRTNLTNLVRDFQKKMVLAIDDIKLPHLEQYLSTKYASILKKYECDICCIFTTDSAKGLASHRSACAKRNKVAVAQ